MNSRPAWVGLGLTEEEPSALSSGGDGVNDHLRRELAARGGESTTLRLAATAAASVDAYLEYRRVVGDADGGVLFTGALHSVLLVPSWRACFAAKRFRRRPGSTPCGVVTRYSIRRALHCANRSFHRLTCTPQPLARLNRRGVRALSSRCSG